MVWRGPDAAVSVVAVYAYSTGLEFELRGFAPEVPVYDMASVLGGQRSSDGGLLFTVQGEPGTLMGAEYRQHTFRARVWLGRREHGDVVLGHEWPDAGIRRRELVIRAEDIPQE